VCVKVCVEVCVCVSRSCVSGLKHEPPSHSLSSNTESVWMEPRAAGCETFVVRVCVCMYVCVYVCVCVCENCLTCVTGRTCFLHPS